MNRLRRPQNIVSGTGSESTHHMRALKSTVPDLISNRLSRCGWIDIPSIGYSMYPFMKPGDVCRFIPAQMEQMRAGDILLFNCRERLIGHRLHRMESRDGTLFLICKGDANLTPDPPVHWEQVVAVLASIQKRRGRFQMDGSLAKLWGKLILALPAYSHWVRWSLRAGC